MNRKNMTNPIYRQLASHLDKLPGGFPSTESGVELRILRGLFTAQEASLALSLTLMPKDVRTIARRANLPVEETAERLEAMAQKGLIRRAERPGSPFFYGAAQYVIGIWEFQVNRLNLELIRDMNEYLPTLFNLETWKKAPQLRTIPVGRSLKIERHVLAHERAEDIVRAHEKFLVAPCICRREHAMTGRGCDKPEETCLVFDAATAFYERNKLGRIIELAEALDILKRADEAGLVLQPSNAKDIVNICCCCGCCCQVLKSIKRHPKPAAVVSTPYAAVIDADTCENCGACVDRCQMEALRAEADRIVLDGDRCIGCGLCVTTCPSGSITLRRKPETEQPLVPATMMDALAKLQKTRFG